MRIQFLQFRTCAAAAAVVGFGLGVGSGPVSAQDGIVISHGGVEETIGVQQTTVVEGLEHPWGLAWLPDGSALITERPGRLRVLRDGVLEDAPVAGVPEVLAEGQGGLLDVTVHPDFDDNGWVYLAYAQGTEEANRTRVARAMFDGAALSALEVVFEVSQEKPDVQHFGARLAWMPDGTLLVSIGDGGNPPVELAGGPIRDLAQDLSSHLGKIVRINDDGSIPDDNPFVNVAGAAPEVWSYGHRNVQGMAIDPATERVWVNEHGALQGDELNLVAPGGNYGWPSVTFSRDYRGATIISPHTSLPGMTDPALVWMDTQAPSGLVVYSGDAFPEWQGHLFSGSLVPGQIRHIVVDAAGQVVDERMIPIGDRVRDVRQGPDGLLYVLTDTPSGSLIRLEPAG